MIVDVCVMCLMAHCVAALLHFLLKSKCLSCVQKGKRVMSIKHPEWVLTWEASLLLVLVFMVCDCSQFIQKMSKSGSVWVKTILL